MSRIMARAEELATAMTEAGVPATVNPRAVATLGTDALVLVGIPDVNPGPLNGGWDLLWRPLVICLHPDPLEAMTRILAAVELLTDWERGLTNGRAVTWQAPNGGEPAPAYELQLTDIVTTED